MLISQLALSMFIISHLPFLRHIQKAAFVAESSGTADKKAAIRIYLSEKNPEAPQGLPVIPKIRDFLS